MGQIRVREELRSTINLLKEAYSELMFTADKANTMDFYMAYEMPCEEITYEEASCAHMTRSAVRNPWAELLSDD